MKVLFAVSDDNISTSIVKKYQKQYKEIISYKNVYFFNAIFRELQRNKSYDRIVISEDLEEFSSSNVEQKDKFIFDKLDNISDEAVNVNGNDVPIILICSERRIKSEDFLVKLFGIGVYNAIIGDDRSTDEVCRLIDKPRSKKEAKLYYKIDSENVSYEKEDDTNVSETEMNSILNHFRRLGKNESKYLDSFNNIVSQYNESQLRVIIAILPENVKSVLREKSPEYKKIMRNEKENSSQNKKQIKKQEVKEHKSSKVKRAQSGISEKTLKDEYNDAPKNVVIPSTMKSKASAKSGNIANNTSINAIFQEDEKFEDILNDVQGVQDEKHSKRGRTRKNSEIEEVKQEVKVPKKRGRPKKVKEIEETDEKIEFNQNMLPGFDDDDEFVSDDEINNKDYTQGTMLPGFDEEDSILSNVDDEYIDEENDDFEDNVTYEEDIDNKDDETFNNNFDNYVENKANLKNDKDDSQEMVKYDNVFDDEEFESLLSGDKKVTAFVGTSKNGTSFMVNNLANILSNMGINTAILDATQNKSAYYIYTNDDENLRNAAIKSIGNLINGVASGVKVNNNLTVYTGIPSQYDEINNSHPIMETLIKNHSIVLIDCDFNTPIEYFDKAQEIYLVQSMDVLTIQPLTEFLRKLKVKNVLDERKIRIILNKLLKVNGVNGKKIVGGMSNYNDPEMSFMTELFDKNIVKVVAEIHFDEDVYAKYLESMIECNIKLSGYPKDFKQKLLNLAGIVYPLLNGSNNKKNNQKNKYNNYTNSFSTGMNNTLDNMRKKY